MIALIKPLSSMPLLGARDCVEGTGGGGPLVRFGPRSAPEASSAVPLFVSAEPRGSRPAGGDRVAGGVRGDRGEVEISSFSTGTGAGAGAGGGGATDEFRANFNAPGVGAACVGGTTPERGDPLGSTTFPLDPDKLTLFDEASGDA